MMKVSALLAVLSLAEFAITGGDAQDMPPSLWRWPTDCESSYYALAVPNTSVSVDFNVQSGCTGGGSETIGWSCPHFMLLSPDMQYAALADNNAWALYGVVGVGSASDCGSCFQLRITSGESGTPSPDQYIVQAVNTGSDVSSGQFDILVGAGGFGIFTACSSDCQSGRVCPGGHCNAPAFSGNFDAWTPDGNCYGGGVRIADDCNKLVTTSSHSFADTTLLYGCPAAINRGYHQNFNVQWARVQCPTSLYQVTGIRRKDDQQYPKPEPQMNLPNNGHTTTTMDCCKPTCAWRQNVESVTDSQFPQVYTCNVEGLPNYLSGFIESLPETKCDDIEPTLTPTTSVGDAASCTTMSWMAILLSVSTVISFF